jgi:hypothetical protein
MQHEVAVYQRGVCTTKRYSDGNNVYLYVGKFVRFYKTLTFFIEPLSFSSFMCFIQRLFFSIQRLFLHEAAHLVLFSSTIMS